MPPVARGADGRRVPHALGVAPALALADDERASVRRRAVDHLIDRNRYDAALTAREAGLVDGATGPAGACLGAHRPPGRSSTAGSPTSSTTWDSQAWLAVAVRAAVLAPAEATEPLRTAIDRCREVDDADGEVSALACSARWPGGAATAGCWPRCCPGWRPSAPGHPLRGVPASARR